MGGVAQAGACQEHHAGRQGRVGTGRSLKGLCNLRRRKRRATGLVDRFGEVGVGACGLGVGRRRGDDWRRAKGGDPSLADAHSRPAAISLMPAQVGELAGGLARLDVAVFEEARQHRPGRSGGEFVGRYG